MASLEKFEDCALTEFLPDHDYQAHVPCNPSHNMDYVVPAFRFFHNFLLDFVIFSFSSYKILLFFLPFHTCFTEHNPCYETEGDLQRKDMPIQRRIYLD